MLCVQLFNHVQLFVAPWAVAPWTVAHQAPLSMEFSRQEYWSGLPFPSPGHLPDPGIVIPAFILSHVLVPKQGDGYTEVNYILDR